MAEVDIKFEREDLEGIVAVGTYVYDAAGRMGIEIDEACLRLGENDACAVTIIKGGELLSEITQAEIEQLSDARRKKGERLACQTKFKKSGEVSIMTKEKVKEEKPETEAKKEEFRKEFEEMPLEKKIASLLELETIALGETFSFILNSPYEIAGKVMDIMAEFGLKLEDDAKKATRPEEHIPKEEKNGNKAKKEKDIPVKKTASKKKAEAKKKTAKKKTTTAKKKEEK